MALQYFNGRIEMVDEHGLVGAKEVVIGVNDVTYTTAEDRQNAAATALLNFADALDEAIDPMITKVDLTLPLISIISGDLKAAPGEQGVAEGANLKLTPLVTDPTRPNRTLPYWLPGAKEGVFLPDFKTVDTTDAELLAWIASFNTDANARVYISDREGVASILNGNYGTRRRNSSS